MNNMDAGVYLITQEYTEGFLIILETSKKMYEGNVF